MAGRELELASIVSSLEMLQQIALNSPDHAQRMTQELQRLCDGYQSPPQNGASFGLASTAARSGPRSPASPRHARMARAAEDPRSDDPDPRHVPGRGYLSKNSLITLSPEVRNSCDRLMGWFEENGEALAPGLV
jgi:hypothetical protein